MSRYIKIIGIIILLAINNIHSQNNNIADCKQCDKPEFRNLRKSLIKKLKNRLKSGQECDKKIVKINIYFIQDSLGKNNFTSTGDNFGHSYSGYNFATDMLKYVNEGYNSNNSLNLPPHINLPVIPKDLQFAIEGIYYIKSNRFNKYRDTINFNNGFYGTGNNFTGSDLDTLVRNRDSCLHLIICGVGAVAVDTSNTGTPKYKFPKSAGGVGESWGDYIIMENYARYALLMRKDVPGDTMTWVLSAESYLWGHEIAHSLSLSHTVRYNTAPPCPTMKFGGFIDTICDDDIPNEETPSAWYMTDTLNGVIHPAERNDSLRKAYPRWWSNNLMDYGGNGTLSPMQILLMHKYLDTIKTAWLIEKSQKVDRSYCSWIGTRIAHYGKKVELSKSCSIPLKVVANLPRKVYATTSVDIYDGFEVQNNGDFEVVLNCPK